MIRPKLNEQEIERKLRSAKAPHPPSHLLDRLKADIPDQVALGTAHPERRPQRMWRNTWAVAASVLALVGMSYVILQTMESSEIQQSAPITARSVEPDMLEKQVAQQAPAANVAAPQPTVSARALESDVTDADGAVAPQPARANEPLRRQDLAFAAPAKDEAASVPAGGREAEGGVEGGVLGGVVGGVAGGVVADTAPREERIVIAQAPAPEMAPPAAPPPPRAAPQAPEVVEATAASSVGAAKMRMSRPKEAKTAGGGQFVDAAADPTSTFGLRVGDDSWSAIRSALNAGRLPAANVVREEEVINHFQYRDEASRSDVTLFAEAAPAPSGESGLYVLRVALRTGAPARAAVVQMEFNSDIVRAYRLVGYQTAEGGGESLTRADLPKDAAVSAVYELRLSQRPSARQQLGVLRLKWEGRETSLQIDGSDVAASWNASLPSLRLASLAAKWAEMLKGSPFAASIAPRELMARVQQLSGELAGDADVAEFVGLVARSVRLIE